MALLQRIAPCFIAGTGAACHFDLSRCEYFGPFAAAIIVANWLQATHDGQYHSFQFPRKPKVTAFLQRSGVMHYIYGEPAPDVQHPDNVTVPVCAVEEATFDIGRPIIDLIKRFVKLSDDNETYLNNCISEVTQNVEDHAQSAIGAVLCARYLEKPGKIRIAMVDRGVGIATTLGRRYPELCVAQAALRSVVHGGFSARTTRHNLGVGISNLWAQVTRQLNGEVFIISEDAVAYNGACGSVRTEPLGMRFPGTGVFLTVPVAGR